MNYSSVTIFGDSLVDAGNALKLAKWYGSLPFTETVDAAPWAYNGYYEGRFSNGFTIVDLIANKYIGQVSKPVFPYGYEDPYIGARIAPFASDPSGTTLNFAYGGAQMRRGDEAVPDLDGQTDAWRDAVDGDADPTGLYTFSFGANDVHDLVPATGAWADLATATKTLQSAATKYVHEIMQVIDDGARNVLLVGVPNIGIQPYYDGVADEPARRAIGTQYCDLLDQMVRAELAKQQLPAGVDLHYAGFRAMQDFVLGQMAQMYGGARVYSFEENGLVFFDKVHPTTQVHALATAYLIDQLNGVAPGDQLKLSAPDFDVSGTIGAAGEIDTIYVSISAKASYAMQLLGLSTLGGDASMLADPRLKLLGPAGAAYASDDDSGMGLDASLSFRGAAAGDYAVQLSAVGALTGKYSFLIESIATGDDIYIVSHASALVFESAGEGNDLVRAKVSYTLGAGVSVETLTTYSDVASSSINLTGNEIAQAIRGNAGSNVIDGRGGADDLWSLGGKDSFLFSTALGAGNVDHIRDFNVRDDTIKLDDAIFHGLTLGTLASGAFAKGAMASQSDDRIIYDPASGNLYYDADGAGGVQQQLWATLNTGLRLSYADFVVY